MMHILFIIFITGTAVGSFLNVIAYRSVHGGTIFTGHSKCPHCKHELKPTDLIPIASYLLLRGKCRYCGKQISLQYPIVEVVTGLLFTFTYYYVYQASSIKYQVESSINLINLEHLVSLVFLLFVVSGFMVLFVTDLKDGLLPNTIVLSAVGAVAAFKLLFLVLGTLSPTQLGYDFLAALVPALLFFLVVYISREKAMGGGDIKLAFLIGLAVGWPAVLVGIFLGFLTGAVAAVTLLLIGKKRFGETLPLGPFLIIGALSALFWGEEIITLYLRALGT